jgi:hypothetical protein
MNLADEFLKRGHSRALVERARATPIEEQSPARVLSAAEVRKFDDAALFRSEWARDASLAKEERAAVAEVERRSAFAVDGLLLPFSILSRDFNVGTASQAGNLSGDAPRRFDLAGDALRAAPLLGALGVPQIAGFSGSPVVPSFATGPSGTAATEVGAVAAGSATTRAQVLAPNRVSINFPVSNQAFIQFNAAGAALLRRNILAGLGAEVERQFFNGSGTGGELLGLRNVSGVGSVVGGPNGAALTFAHLCDLEGATNSGVAELGPGFAVNGATRRYLRTLARGAGLPYVWEGGASPLLGYRAAVSSNLPSNIAKGTGSNLSTLAFSRDWSQAVLCIFGAGVGVVLDRVTLADRAQTRVVAKMYCDVAWIQPAAFSTMSDAATV